MAFLASYVPLRQNVSKLIAKVSISHKYMGDMVDLLKFIVKYTAEGIVAFSSLIGLGPDGCAAGKRLRRLIDQQQGSNKLLLGDKMTH